jgi:hypothetical protein
VRPGYPVGATLATPGAFRRPDGAIIVISLGWTGGAAMADLLIRGLGDYTMAELKRRAGYLNKSVNQVAKEIITDSVPLTWDEFNKRADASLERTRGRIHGDSTDLIREDRDSR